MTDDLLSLRVLVASPAGRPRRPVPAGGGGFDGADRNRRSRRCGRGAALCSPTASISPISTGRCRRRKSRQSVAALRAARQAAVHRHSGDRRRPPARRSRPTALAGKPSRTEEAQWLLERSMRVRVPSRVLVVDDSATMRSIVRKALAGDALSVRSQRGRRGLRRAQTGAQTAISTSSFSITTCRVSAGLETLAEFKREKRRRQRGDDHVDAGRRRWPSARARWARLFSKSRFSRPISRTCCAAFTACARSIRSRA